MALGADGQELVVADVTIDERAETVYNFEVEEYHTYFVGEVGVWVHNAEYDMTKIKGFKKSGILGKVGQFLYNGFTGKGWGSDEALIQGAYSDSMDSMKGIFGKNVKEHTAWAKGNAALMAKQLGYDISKVDLKAYQKANAKVERYSKAYSETGKESLKERIKGEYVQNGKNITSELNKAKGRFGEIENKTVQKRFQEQSLEWSQKQICNVNGIYMMLKEEGANVGSLNDFIVKGAKNGGIVKNDDNLGFVRIGNYNTLVESYTINGKPIKLRTTTDINEVKAANTKMALAKNKSHMWGLARAKDDKLFISDPGHPSQFGKSPDSHYLHTAEKYYYIQR